MKKILIVTTVPDTLAFILREQPRFLCNHFNVELATSPGERFDLVVQAEGVPVHAVPMARGISVFKDCVAILRMIRLLRARRPAMVHSYTPKAGLVSMLAAWICGVPVRVHTFTGLIFPSSRGLRRWLLICADRLICRCATLVVPEGAGVKQDMQSHAITAKPLDVIGFGNIAGVDVNRFSPHEPRVQDHAARLRAELNLDERAFVFCFVGRLHRDKGLRELLAAFHQMPEHCHLALAGDLDLSGPVDDETLAGLRTHPRVHELGFVSDVRPAMRASDVLVLPSYREGFPNVALQAGAMELPVIATDINGCNEIIEPGYNGWLVPARDAAALADAMRVACEMPAAQRRALGRAARERVCERFERARHWERMATFYRGALTSRKRG